MIYSLRTFKKEGIQEDETIGRRIQTIYKDSNKEDFEFHWNKTLGEEFMPPDYEDVYGLIYSEEVCIPLYKYHRYYVVTEHGNTYANITFKK